MGISEAIRKQIKASGVSHYQIAQGSGVSTSVLSRFMAGETSITLATAEKLATYFELELKPKSKGSNRRGKTST
ncbi:helix-turn-helix transcriptional regulator [Bremerella sp. JC770]|uniref:helix-turn-helix domain-containing protein n=1 Tax=Bremerella sp. JC770 TaxID=3232137 RepID=UPI00345A83F6